MDHREAHVAAEVDHIAVFESALDTPLVPEHLQCNRFTLRNLIHVAHKAQRVAAVHVEVLFAVGHLRVGAVDVDASAARFDHVCVAAGMVAMHG